MIGPILKVMCEREKQKIKRRSLKMNFKNFFSHSIVFALLVFYLAKDSRHTWSLLELKVEPLFSTFLV